MNDKKIIHLQITISFEMPLVQTISQYMNQHPPHYFLNKNGKNCNYQACQSDATLIKVNHILFYDQVCFWTIQPNNWLPKFHNLIYTGKSLSEALIFASTNPQYDDILFSELQVQYMKMPSSEHGENMLCTEIDFDIQNNLCTKHVLPMFCKNKRF